ncbi:hypothetical protein RND81_08G169800 [Saponaria officinalis]|uniref:Mitochondrial import inner membrane translocase subunit TIM50 n=1 Tax=Saponaria officinalis TaxID=3572 RepID=A0AAW1J923_SAPOF
MPFLVGHTHSGVVYKVTEGSGSHSEKRCNRSTTHTLSVDICKQSTKELCLKASQPPLNPNQLMQLSSFNAKPLDSCEEKFSPLDDVSLVDTVNMKPLNPWARAYYRVGDQHLSCKQDSMPSFLASFKKQELTVSELCLKVSQTLKPKQLTQLSSFKTKLDQNAPLDSREEKNSSQDVSVADSQDSVLSVSLRPLNPCAREYHRLSCKQESMPYFLESLRKQERKKLLVLDINGILADIVYPPPKGYKADTKIAGRAVFTRPFCSDFLKFCLERFNVAIWSSRSRKIIDRLLNYLMGDMKDRLVFCWDLSHCTPSNFRCLENKHKTLVFKELRKVWDNYDPHLPWEKGFFNESNTFLLDDTPYKALLNPAHTAIFPYSYGYKDIADNAIGPGGSIRAYLEEIAAADNVQRYIEKHPFGQGAITERSMSWQFYDRVIKDQTAGAVPVVG